MKKTTAIITIVLLIVLHSCNSKSNNSIEKKDKEIVNNDILKNNASQEKIVDEPKSDFITAFIKKYESNNYKIRLNSDCDLNKDGLTDKLIVFETTEQINNKNSQNSPICILIKTDSSYTTYENKNIIYSSFFNSMAEGLQDVVIKNNYFTIEQNTGAGNIRQNEYVTFTYDLKAKQIVLHKYGVELVSVDGLNDKTLSYNKKQFGNLVFNDFNIDILKDIINK